MFAIRGRHRRSDKTSATVVAALLTAAAILLPAAPAGAQTSSATTSPVHAEPGVSAGQAAAIAGAAALPPGFKNVGYLPYWAGGVNTVQYNRLSHINYAFAQPNSDGSIQPVPNASKLQSLVSTAHQWGVKVLISFGGGTDDSAFEALAGNATGRAAFVNATVSLLGSYGLDGADIDWEYPEVGQSSANFTQLMSQLSAALHARGKLLTAAVVSDGNTQRIQNAVFPLVDFLNIMTYDGGSPHANYDWTISFVQRWKDRGLPAAKTVVGVPFYSRPVAYSFAQLVAIDPANAFRDCTTVNGTQVCYNGVPTVQRKTQWAMANAGGIMSWELSQDTTGPFSLITTIDQATSSVPYGPITGLVHKCIDVRSGQSVNGTPIQLYSCNGSGAQSWTIDGGALRALGKCLDVPNSSTANGVAVQLYDCNGSGAQSWTSLANGSLRNARSGKCLDVSNWGTADGTRLWQWDCYGGPNQLWQIPGHPIPVRSGQISGLGGKCIDIRASGTANGTPVQLYGCNGSAAQSWALDSGALRALGKCLDVPGSATANGSKVQLWDCNASAAQLWLPAGDRTLRNIHSGRCLDVPGSIATDGARLQLWDCNGTAAQRWLVPG